MQLVVELGRRSHIDVAPGFHLLACRLVVLLLDERGGYFWRNWRLTPRKSRRPARAPCRIGRHGSLDVWLFNPPNFWPFTDPFDDPPSVAIRMRPQASLARGGKLILNSPPGKQRMNLIPGRHEKNCYSKRHHQGTQSH